MTDTAEQIAQIEKEIRETPYHKGTALHISKLRGRLARLKDRQIESSGKKGGGVGYAVKKQGDATVVLVGPPSAGKSTLLNKLTNAQSKVAPYAFTTVSVIPGMMKYKDAYIQILDVPGLIEGAEEGKGRGREVLSVVRGADLILIMTDIERPRFLKRIEEVLYRNAVRINDTPPNVAIEKKLKGGIIVHSNFKQDFPREAVGEIANEMGIKNVEITIKEKLPIEKLIDAFSTNRAYIPAIFIINKVDLATTRINELIHYNKPLLVSAEKGIGHAELRKLIWESLGFVRIYLVKPDEEPNLKDPIVVHRGNSLSDVAQKIGEDFAEGKKLAKIWGTGAKFPGQEVSLKTRVQEGMQVRFL